MSYQDNNKSAPIIAKRVAPRYISIQENVFQALTPHTYKVYTALRFEADYSQEFSSVKRTGEQIAELSGIGRARTFESFNELEDYGLLKRDCTDGKETVYWVAQSMYFFTQEKHPILIPVHDTDTPVHDADTPVHDMDTNPLISSLTLPKENIPAFSKSGRNKEFSNYKKDERFMRFYSEYPKKEDPKDAYKAFKSIIGNDDALLDQIITDIQLRKQKHSKWQDRQYIKYPAVYLRKGEYLGEIFNANEENQEKEKLKKEENEKRMLEQENQSKLSAEREKKELEQIQKDGRAFRIIKQKIKSSGVRPSGLKNLRDSMGLK